MGRDMFHQTRLLNDQGVRLCTFVWMPFHLAPFWKSQDIKIPCWWAASWPQLAVFQPLLSVITHDRDVFVGLGTLRAAEKLCHIYIYYYYFAFIDREMSLYWTHSYVLNVQVSLQNPSNLWDAEGLVWFAFVSLSDLKCKKRSVVFLHLGDLTKHLPAAEAARLHMDEQA